MMHKPVSTNPALSSPVRMQLRRTKGWKMPPNTVMVARPSAWCNPYKVGVHGTAKECVEKFARKMVPYTHVGPRNTMADLLLSEASMGAIRDALKGKNLACWCRLCPEHEKDGKPFDVDCPVCWPCHADVLLQISNS
jgi:hypothetical protein